MQETVARPALAQKSVEKCGCGLQMKKMGEKKHNGIRKTQENIKKKEEGT